MTERPEGAVPAPDLGEPGDAAPEGTEADPVATELLRLPELPVEEHVAVFDRVHQQLRDRLADAGGPADETPAT